MADREGCIVGDREYAVGESFHPQNDTAGEEEICSICTCYVSYKPAAFSVHAQLKCRIRHLIYSSKTKLYKSIQLHGYRASEFSFLDH